MAGCGVGAGLPRGPACRALGIQSFSDLFTCARRPPLLAFRPSNNTPRIAMKTAFHPRAFTALASLLAPTLAGAASLKPVYQFAANPSGAYPHGAGPSAEMIEAP